jgi:hypothetical protein
MLARHPPQLGWPRGGRWTLFSRIRCRRSPEDHRCFECAGPFPGCPLAVTALRHAPEFRAEDCRVGLKISGLNRACAFAALGGTPRDAWFPARRGWRFRSQRAWNMSRRIRASSSRENLRGFPDQGILVRRCSVLARHNRCTVSIRAIPDPRLLDLEIPRSLNCVELISRSSMSCA